MWGLFSSRTTSPRQPAGTSPDPAAVKRDLERLERSWRMIQAHISDAEKRGTVSHLESLRLSELRGIALDADDVLDEWKYELLRAEAEGGGARKRKPGEDSSCDPAARILTGDPSLGDRMARQIDGIMKRYDEIVARGGAFRWDNWDGERRRGHSDRAPSSSFVDEGYVFDREGDKRILVDYLTDGCATSKLSVIPVVGMGLMGKTTLVQLVYGDPKVKQNFHHMVWLSLRRDSDLMSLLRSVVESVTSKPCGHSQLNPIQTILQRCLQGKKFLLVLDDVYREHLHFWDMLKSSIGSCSQGSVVLITTKIGEVAERTKTVEAPVYLFDSISNDSCWLLFKKYASVGQDSPVEGPGMEGICKKVTEICEGMPLVAKLLGISFRNWYSREEWVDYMEYVIEKEILPKLESSYQLLPEHLKPCLLYCSLFPKGYFFCKDRLVRLWMSQGLVRSKIRVQMEDIGIKYFDELLSRSFFLQSATDEKLYFMPNLICDLVYSLSSNEHSRVVDTHTPPSEARHLSLILHECKSMKSFYTYRSLRSLLVIRTFPFASIMHLEIQDEVFCKLNRLRSLDLSYTSIRELPDSIGHLKHLRFLALNHTKIKTLPESIHNLYNLEILELKGCLCLQELPRGIGSLINLQYLDTDSGYVPILRPLQIQRLTSLQRLPAFNLHKGNEFCGIQELQDLINLRELGILGLCNVTNLDDARKANLQNKTNLRVLKLIWPAIDTAPSSEQICDSDRRDLLISTDETGMEDEQNVQDLKNATGSVDEQHTDHEKSSSCDIDDNPEKSMDIPDEQESNSSNIQLRNRINNMHILDSVSSDAAVSEKDLLESLLPCATIEMLWIKSYHGPRFPDWIGDSSFIRLISMELINCRCVVFPPVGQLPRLRFLSIDGMLVELIGQGLHGTGNGNAFPKLEMLSFRSMDKWEKWDGVKQGDFPNLRKLCLFNCPQLRRLPDQFPSLERLEVERCMELTEIPNLPSLQVLELHCCDGLTALPKLSSLCSLTTMCCEKLESLPPLPQLQNLWIEDCEQLRSIVFCNCCLPSAVLSCRISDLNGLLIANCHRLHFSPQEPLANIQISYIDGCLVLSKLNKTRGDGN